MLAVGTRFSISPAQTGFALSYVLYTQVVGRISLRVEPLSRIVRIIPVLWFNRPTTCRSREQHEFRRAYRLLRS